MRLCEVINLDDVIYMEFIFVAYEIKVEKMCMLNHLSSPTDWSFRLCDSKYTLCQLVCHFWNYNRFRMNDVTDYIIWWVSTIVYNICQKVQFCVLSSISVILGASLRWTSLTSRRLSLVCWRGNGQLWWVLEYSD
jgi:hypothetical protein